MCSAVQFRDGEPEQRRTDDNQPDAHGGPPASPRVASTADEIAVTGGGHDG